MDTTSPASVYVYNLQKPLCFLPSLSLSYSLSLHQVGVEGARIHFITDLVIGPGRDMAINKEESEVSVAKPMECVM